MSNNLSKSQRKTILTLSGLTVIFSLIWFAKENFQIFKAIPFLNEISWFDSLNLEPLVTLFASSIPVCTLFWPFKAKYKSQRLKDTIVVDMHNSKEIHIGKDDYHFKATLSHNSMYSQHLIVRHHPSTLGSAIINDVNYFNEVRDVTIYNVTNEDKSPNIDDIIVLKNRFGRYALVRIVSIAESKGGVKGMDITVEYVINKKEAINFS
ncbi:hypothetical protein [Brenneria goodwinii]|uniref:hypothetical protein n=1 Tax=Brenneria goodwinii TaxID=1109412 RepID=UPI0036EEDA03